MNKKKEKHRFQNFAQNYIECHIFYLFIKLFLISFRVNIKTLIAEVTMCKKRMNDKETQN